MVINNYICEEEKKEGGGEGNEVFRLSHLLYEVCCIHGIFLLFNKNRYRISLSNTHARIFISQKAELNLGFNVKF